MRLASQNVKPHAGVWRQATTTAMRRPVAGREGPQARHQRVVSKLGGHRIVFAGLYVFTLLLYVRPNDLWPNLIGEFPIVKIIAIATLIGYLASKVSQNERLMIWPLEMKMLAIIVFFGLVWAPMALSPKDSVDTLFDTLLKVVVIFVLMINLIDTRERLDSILKLVVACGTWLAIEAVRSYFAGVFNKISDRIEGAVGGIFSNPNDLATALNLLLPIAVALALNRRGLQRLIFFGSATMMAAAVILTFSRAGFLGLMAIVVLVVSKARYPRNWAISLVVAGLLVVSVAAMPGSYRSRLLTIFNSEQDETGSAQQRKAVMERALDLAIKRPIFGVGMGNFHSYSIHEKKAHNAYLEIAAELGVGGFIAYLIITVAPLSALRRIERLKGPRGPTPDPALYNLCLGLQATFFAYMICSFFASIQYQWFLYYPVAYAVALRRIHAFEESARNEERGRTEEVSRATPRRRAQGLLWPAEPSGRAAS